MTLSELVQRLLDMAVQAPEDELPALIGELEAVKARAWLRIATPKANCHSSSDVADVNLAAEEAAERLGVSKAWLYRNAHRLPFAVRIGRRLLFSGVGLARWNRQQGVP